MVGTYEKMSGTSAETNSDLCGHHPVIKRFSTSDILTLYQSCNSALVYSLRVVAGLQRLLSVPANGKLVTPHAQRERGKVIGCGVHIYIHICLWTKKYLNRTLEINSPFQTFAVGLLVEFID